MLTIKDISEKFNISKSTLYGWEKERPEIFAYLQRADDKYEELRDITIILQKHAKTIKATFELKEIEFIITLRLKINDAKDIEHLHLLYSQAIAHEIKQRAPFVMPIYTKIEQLNLVERYIFASNYKEILLKLPKIKEERTGLIEHYFKPFLC
jgi:DNA-binding transcriptional MerR regulator